MEFRARSCKQQNHKLGNASVTTQNTPSINISSKNRRPSQDTVISNDKKYSVADKGARKSSRQGKVWDPSCYLSAVVLMRLGKIVFWLTTQKIVGL